MGKSNIPWTDWTWPIVRGCTPISPGCGHCWAPRQAIRSSGVNRAHEGLVKSTASGPRWTGKVVFVEDELRAPLAWVKPRRCLVAPMSDFFHEDVTEASLDRAFAIMAITGKVTTYQILTKRAQRMALYLGDEETPGRIAIIIRQMLVANWVPTRHLERATHLAFNLGSRRHLDSWLWPLPGVWIMVSVEDEDRAMERIPWLIRTPAVIRGVSLEPLLGEVDLDPPICGNDCEVRYGYEHVIGSDGATPFCAHCDEEMGFDAWLDPLNGGLNWVILGCESGKGRRPMMTDWARKIRDQCIDSDVPFFLKQMVVDGKIAEIPRLDGHPYAEYPHE